MVFDSFYDSCTCHIVIDVIQRDRAITVKLYEVQIALSLVDKQVASPPRLQTEAQWGTAGDGGRGWAGLAWQTRLVQEKGDLAL